LTKRRVLLVFALPLLFAALQPQAVDAASSPVRRVDLGDGLFASIDVRGPFLETEPLPREGLFSFAARLCGDRDRGAAVIAQENSGSSRLLRGVRYRVPFDCLLPELQSRVLRGLFPEDQATPEGWRHRLGLGPDGTRPDLWRLAEWFTGDGGRWRELRDRNGLRDEDLEPGGFLVIPAALLRPELRGHVPAVFASTPPDLEYGSDARGPYALYRLKAGEALYSSVVIRFTGRLFAADVYPLAEEVAERSGIRDVTDIPIGFPIKVPLDYLSPEYLPPGDPRRVEYEVGLAQTARYMNQVQALGLEGVVVVLDAGHGGRDVGASAAGVWESVHVYDVMLRVKRLLESTTGAVVLTTTQDDNGYQIIDRDALPHSRGHRVLTEPPYPIETAQVGTHLRWYLANYLMEQRLSAKAEPERVVFLSIHADSLHPSVRGAMVYVPGLLPLPPTYGKSEAVYTSRREVRARPSVAFSRQELVRSEGLSRDLANHLIAGFRKGGLAVHPNKPVRDRIVRGRGSPWVPAVLRYNAIPAKVLIEVCNLANEQDRKLIQTRAFRERVARAVVDGLLSYYGHESGAQGEVAATSRE
jgi:N-acetylmuramoyl-L-alanine amidase